MLLSCAEQLLGDRPLADRLGLIHGLGSDGIDVRWATVDQRAKTIARHLPRQDS